MKFYLKLIFFYFVLQNVLSDDKLSFSSLSNTETNFSGLFENNTINGLNSTTLNSTENLTPVLLNCTNGISNSTDLSQCTPINITLSYQCTKVDYDFLIYTLQWQPRLCFASSSRDCHSNEEPKWRIQGLRGSFRNGTRPVQCCSDKQLKISELSSIMSDLKEQWVYEKDSTSSDSMTEEWNLHGSCVQEAEGRSSLELYSKSLDLNRRMPVGQWLSNAKIEPSNDKKYGLQFFNYSITSKLDKKFQLRCKTLDYEKRISIIDTINVCLDRQTSIPIDCPADFDSNCLDMVYYPKNLLEAYTKVPDEVMYRDMNYYRYNNYHSSYSPLMSPYGGYGYGYSRGNTGLLTGAAIGATGATAALALPAAYYYFKNKNKYNKYNNLGGGGFGQSTPWYSSQTFGHNSFVPPPPSYNYGNQYGSPKNFGNLAGSNLYPRQTYPSSVFSGSPYQGNAPSYPAYNSNSKPSYPAYGNAPPPYSKYGNSAYPKQSSPYDSPPAYSSGAKPSYPAYGNTGSNTGSGLYPKLPTDTAHSSGNYKPSAPSFSEVNNKPSYPSSNSQPSYPSYPSSNNNKPSYPAYPSSNSKPSYPAYPSSNPKSSNIPKSSGGVSKPKSSGGIFGGIFGSSSSSGSGRRSGGGGSRSGGFGGSRRG